MAPILANAAHDIQLISGEPFANSERVAGVVELVDARDSKSRSARSVGSIPTARTILLSMIHLPHRTVGGSCQSGP